VKNKNHLGCIQKMGKQLKLIYNFEQDIYENEHRGVKFILPQKNNIFTIYIRISFLYLSPNQHRHQNATTFLFDSHMGLQPDYQRFHVTPSRLGSCFWYRPP